MEILQLLFFAGAGALALLLLVNLVIIAGYSKVNSTASYFRNGENSVTFIGHGTALIHVNNTNILTDPNFNDWIIAVHRVRAAGMKIEDLPKIDAILISHGHRDHLDKWSIKQFPKNTTILISRGNGDILRGWGFTDVREMEPEEKIRIGNTEITAESAKHSGARNSATADYPKALSYVIEGKKIRSLGSRLFEQSSKTVYFAGDTGLSDNFGEIGKKYKIDMALLPIGAYRPRWFMKSHHMNPEDALDAMKILGAKEMVPIHWGSFRMAFDGTDESKNVLLGRIENKSIKNKIRVLGNGEKYILGE